MGSEAERDQRLLFFGDSFTAGVADPEGRGWVGRMVAASHAAGAPITAYALGVRGATSVQIACRWAAEAAWRLDADADCRIVLCMGANDAKEEDGRPRVALDASVAALSSVLDGARAIGLPALVVGPPPLGDAAQLAGIAARERAFADACAGRSVPFVRVLEPLRASRAWTDEVAAGDGAHPGAGGHADLARLVLAAGWLEWLDGGRR